MCEQTLDAHSTTSFKMYINDTIFSQGLSEYNHVLILKKQAKAYLGRPPNSHSPQMYGPRYKDVD